MEGASRPDTGYYYTPTQGYPAAPLEPTIHGSSVSPIPHKHPPRTVRAFGSAPKSGVDIVKKGRFGGLFYEKYFLGVCPAEKLRDRFGAAPRRGSQRPFLRSSFWRGFHFPVQERVLETAVAILLRVLGPQQELVLGQSEGKMPFQTTYTPCERDEEQANRLLVVAGVDDHSI